MTILAILLGLGALAYAHHQFVSLEHYCETLAKRLDDLETRQHP